MLLLHEFVELFLHGDGHPSIMTSRSMFGGRSTAFNCITEPFCQISGLGHPKQTSPLVRNIFLSPRIASRNGGSSTRINLQRVIECVLIAVVDEPFVRQRKLLVRPAVGDMERFDRNKISRIFCLLFVFAVRPFAYVIFVLVVGVVIARILVQSKIPVLFRLPVLTRIAILIVRFSLWSPSYPSLSRVNQTDSFATGCWPFEQRRTVR